MCSLIFGRSEAIFDSLQETVQHDPGTLDRCSAIRRVAPIRRLVILRVVSRDHRFDLLRDDLSRSSGTSDGASVTRCVRSRSADVWWDAPNAIPGSSGGGARRETRSGPRQLLATSTPGGIRLRFGVDRTSASGERRSDDDSDQRRDATEPCGAEVSPQMSGLVQERAPGSSIGSKGSIEGANLVTIALGRQASISSIGHEDPETSQSIGETSQSSLNR